MVNMNLFNLLLSEMAAPEMTNLIGKFIKLLFDNIGNYGVTVIVFTIIIKVALSPLDVWQKIATRKQSKSMARLKPQMEKLQRQYANNPEMLRIKQSELYRKEKVTSSMFASCLPMIVTIVIFFVVFSGFNAMVKYQNELIIYNMYNGYHSGMSDEELLALYNAQVGDQFRFLWIQNIFMPDSWADVVPSLKDYVGTGLGQIGASLPSNVNSVDYNNMLGPAMEAYNKSNFWDIGNWNGYMILPILSVIMSILSSKFMQYTMPQQQTGTEEQQKQAQMTQKIMMYTMPLMIGIFALFYSGAFSLYLFISNMITTIFNLVFNIVAKKKDREEEQKKLETTYR